MWTVFAQLSFAQQLMLVLITVVTVLLGLYAINWCLLTILSIKGRGKTPPAPRLDDMPEVTMHIPLFNERLVAARLIQSCLKMDYPAEKLKVVVVDDSTDGTTEVVEPFAREFPQNVKIIHRMDRVGFKAGALKTALENTDSEFVMIFDADYVPPPDLLKRLVPYMYVSADVAFVQTRSTYLNANQSWITKALSLAIDGYGIIDQRARYAANLLAHFSGTGGLFRRSAIQSVGGWSSDTLTEDLDLSIRLQLEGWKYIYLPELTVPGEIPPSLKLLRRQQHRWARGFAQCIRKHYHSIIGSRSLSFFQKFEALMLLATYFVCPISIVSLALLIPYFYVFPLSFFFNEYWQTTLGPLASAISASIYISPLLLYGATVSELSEEKRLACLRLTNIVGIALLGMGTLITNSKATIKGLLGGSSAFERTTKYGAVDI